MHDEIELPSGITFAVDSGNVVSISGPKGKAKKNLKLKGVKIKSDGKKISVEGAMRELNTVLSHIRNMIKGSKDGYSQKMKVLHAHFPMAITVGPKELSIKNFVGEKKPRFSKIVGDTKVELKGTDIMVTGPNKEDVCQTVANMRTATKIRNRDSRVFKDGIYPVSE